MADRTIVVTLRAEAGQYRTAMNQAADSAEKAGTAATGAGKSVQSSAEQIAMAGKKVTDSRRQQMDAAARLNTAEKKLDEVKRNGKSTASQIAQAEERVLTSRNRLEKATDGLSSAEKAHSQSMQVATKQANSSQSAFAKLAKQAEANREAWTTAGTALSIFGGAVVGLGVAAAKTGGEYNTLQQTSRAAMKTLMGGAQEANAQMDKLDKFAKSSPFAKQVFIQAQQQLIGFGVEAKRVIPYLDAIQNAVAATGGSNDDISSVVETMSKIQSSAKITAQDLNEFGNRGIDAAGLIGAQMGKTGAEIREQITKGTIGADEALDALAKGMAEKFDGAAAGVKETMTGAMDRVKSAWRDLSAAMVEPFVSQDGGGMAVDWLNGIADKMREIEGLSPAAKTTGAAIAGIAGAGSLAAGSFLLMAPRIVETKKALDTLAAGGGIVGKTTTAMTGLGKVLGIAGLAFTAFQAANWLANKATKASIPGIEKLNSELAEMAKHGGDLTGAFGNSNGFLDWVGGSASIKDMGDALQIVGLRSEQGITGLVKFREAITPGRQEMERAKDGIEAYDKSLAGMVDSGKMDQAQKAFKKISDSAPKNMSSAEIMENFGKYREALQGTANDLEVTNLTEKDYYEWMRGNIPPAIQEATEAQKKAADGYTGMSEAAQAAQEHLEEVRKGLLDGANGFLDFTAKAKESKTTLKEWIDDMEKQVEAQAGWMDNLSKLAERGAPQELLDQLMAMGPQGAAMVKKLADGSDEDMQRVIDVFAKSKKNVNEFANEVAGIPSIDLEADASKLEDQVEVAKGRLKELEKLPTTPEVSAKIKLLKEKIKEAEAKLDELEKKPTNPKVGANTKPAKDNVAEFDEWLKNHKNPLMNIDAKVKIINEGQIRNMPETLLNPNRKKQSAPGVEKRAAGGPISGPGSGTSDSIPAMLSNGEHVWTAMEVQRAGGHGAIEAMRRAVMSGNAFAKGGAVGTAEKRVDNAETELRRARRVKSSAKSKSSKAAADRRIWAAEDEVKAAKKSLKSAKDKAKADEKSAKLAEQQAKEAKRIADQKAKEERERKARVNDLRGDLRVDLRRGSIRDQVTGGLSGGYSAVDRLFDLGGNQDLSKGSRSKATSSARKFEANLKALYSQAEKIDAKLKKAQDKATELKGIKDSVASGLLGQRSIDVGDYQNFSGGQWTTHSGLSGATRRMTADVGAMKAFAGKLKKLAEAGIPGAIIQEIAQAGVAEGSTMADAFLNASKAEQKSYIGAWNDYEKYANQAGQYVTEGFYKGGSAAADGVVKGLEGKQKNVESAIANLAKVMESTFKSVLGIHSPSRVMADLGGFTAEGLVQGMLGGVSDVQSAAAALGSAAVPNMMAFAPDMSMDVGVNPVVADDEGTAGLAMQDMSATTLDAMAQMQLAVSDGFAGMLANTQAAQAGMLLDTQLNQTGMLTATQGSNASQLLDTQTQQAAMLLNTQTQNAAMLLDTQTQQESMRSTVLSKQTGQRTASEEQQELMRLMLIDKQASMLSKSSTDFESMKNTTGTKFSTMRTNTDTTMSGMYGDYDARLGDLKQLNKTGFESLLGTSNANMSAIRDGMDGQMRDAKPELGANLNRLIAVFSSFTASVNKAFGDVGVKLDAPKSLKYADGGVMPGYSPGRDIHHFRSPSAGDLYLSGGEAFMRPEFTDMVGGEKGIHALNSAARRGDSDSVTHMLGGMAFADGGVMPRIPGVNAFADSGVWRNLWAITKEKFPNATLNSAYRGGSMTVSGNMSHHSRGNAIDTTPSMDIFNFWRNTYGADLAELIFSPAGGKQIKNGKNYTYSGAVKAQHYSHVHIAAIKALSEAMAGGLPGMGGEMSHPFLDKAGVSPGDDLAKSYAKAAEKLTQDIYAKHSKMLPDGFMGGLGKGIMSNAIEGLIGKAKEYGKTTAVSGSSAGDPAVKAAVRKVAEEFGWGNQWGDIDWLISRESGWNPKAANPSSSARGLFQKMTSIHGPVEDTVEGQARWGFNYIKDRYTDPRGAKAWWSSHNWYEGGTDRAKSGLAVVGENGPELVNFKGGEQVMSTTDSMKFMSANRTYIPNSGGGRGIDYDALAKAVVDNLPPSLVVNNDNAGLIEDRIARKTVQEFSDKQALYTMGV